MPASPVYEMLWDCRFCGAQKLLGLTHRHCPNCGAQQDANGRYFPPDSERIAVQDHRYVGADIVCRYCGTATSNRARCCGNSPKFKDEPVYDDKCDYHVNRWHTERVDTAQGNTTASVNWPASVVARPGSCVGCEREGARTETYTVVFQDAKKEPYRCDFPQPKRAGFAPGSKWQADIRRLVGTLDCDSLAKP